MSTDPVSHELAQLAAVPGVIGCALVDAATGMVLHSASRRDDAEPLAEAARDYWQVHKRNGGVFDGLGGAVAILVVHEHGVLNLLPCGDDLVLVTLAERSRVDFSTWPRRMQPLRALVRRFQP